jgi:hypothetical protein
MTAPQDIIGTHDPKWKYRERERRIREHQAMLDDWKRREEARHPIEIDPHPGDIQLPKPY